MFPVWSGPHKGQILWHIGNAALDCLRLFDAVQPQYAQLSFCRIHQSRYKPHKGGFPGSIRTNNGCQLPFFTVRSRSLRASTRFPRLRENVLFSSWARIMTSSMTLHPLQFDFDRSRHSHAKQIIRVFYIDPDFIKKGRTQVLCFHIFRRKFGCS